MWADDPKVSLCAVFCDGAGQSSLQPEQPKVTTLRFQLLHQQITMTTNDRFIHSYTQYTSQLQAYFYRLNHLLFLLLL